MLIACKCRLMHMQYLSPGFFRPQLSLLLLQCCFCFFFCYAHVTTYGWLAGWLAAYGVMHAHMCMYLRVRRHTRYTNWARFDTEKLWTCHVITVAIYTYTVYAYMVGKRRRRRRNCSRFKGRSNVNLYIRSSCI